MKPINIEKEKENYLHFIEGRKTCVMSMLNDEGEPFISNSPVVKIGDTFYIYISRIADHYRFIENSKVVDMLLIADEASTHNHFATERLRFKCTPENLGNEGHETIFEAFSNTHGNQIMSLLKTLDFSLFSLTPIEGRYVVGFGKAFDVNPSGTKFEHVVVDKK
ncbi:pyridoxamine 5'-phosphate oxidase family protein [Metasolibacillus sp. FSL K6-0083]|uniref:HugZ family pyridoxamine 5'-phosphate oxidase n=1 Tax=Metasolibacillus sp. FSL K6-0083 TaxID=2921416 RepID=UPI00315AB47B